MGSIFVPGRHVSLSASSVPENRLYAFPSAPNEGAKNKPLVFTRGISLKFLSSETPDRGGAKKYFFEVMTGEHKGQIIMITQASPIYSLLVRKDKSH